MSARNNNRQELQPRIERVLDKIRPFIRGHGGDVAIREVKDTTVVLDILGTCANCTLANLTYNKIVRGLILETIPQIKEVVIGNMPLTKSSGENYNRGKPKRVS